MQKEQPFTVEQGPFEELVSSLKDKDPSIIGKTCQMLSAIKITMHPELGLRYLIGVIDQIRQKQKDKTYKFSEETLSDLQIGAIDEYLPKVLEERKWVYSIQKYILGKLGNSLDTDKDRSKRYVPYYVMDAKDVMVLNPEIDKVEVRTFEIEKAREIRETELVERIDKLFREAKLTDREKTIIYYKETTEYSEEKIADILTVSRSTVTKDYAKAREKLDTYRTEHPEFETYLRK